MIIVTVFYPRLRLSLIMPAARAAVTNVTWLGGAGIYSDAAKWVGGVVPNNAANTFVVFIDGGNVVSSIVTGNVNATINALTVDAGDTFRLENGTTFVVNDGAGSSTITTTVRFC